MIVETIFSTLNRNGEPNFAPMGLEWGEDFVTVRPFRNTRTYQNLCSHGYGVASITDEALAFVQCGLYKMVLPHFSAQVVPGVVFRRACSWRELEVSSQNGSNDRADLRCRVLYKGWQKDFLGFCRAGNAVIEATILATRLAFYDQDTVRAAFTRYGEIVDKTGDEAEKEAFRLVRDYIQNKVVGENGTPMMED